MLVKLQRPLPVESSLRPTRGCASRMAVRQPARASEHARRQAGRAAADDDGVVPHSTIPSIFEHLLVGQQRGRVQGARAGGVEAAALVVGQFRVRPGDDHRVELQTLHQVIAADHGIAVFILPVVLAAIEAVDVGQLFAELFRALLRAGDDGDGAVARLAEALERFLHGFEAVRGHHGHVALAAKGL